MKTYLTILSLACFVLLLLSAPLPAATVTVTNTNDALAGSLRQALLDANPNDTIVFKIPTTDPGYYAPTQVYTINLASGLSISKSLAISGVGSRIVVRRNVAAAFSVFTTSAFGVTIDSLAISNGLAVTLGGGINIPLGSSLVTNCTFSGNQAPNGAGGGVFNGAEATIANCTFTANGALTGGAAIQNQNGTLTVSDCTLAGNTAVANGGVLDNVAPGIVDVFNTIIAGNQNPNSYGDPDVYGVFISDGYNFIGVEGPNSTGFGNPGSRDQTGTLAKPADPKLGLLLDHGGWTQTMAPLLGSLVIDQGKSDQLLLAFDQRGFPRSTDQAGTVNAVDGDGSDIGAVELSEYQTGPTFTVTNTQDHDYGVCGTDVGCTLREALNAANVDLDANTIAFASDVKGTITNSLTPDGLVITQPVTINGPGARSLTISGGNTSQCVWVQSGTVVINGLTFADGSNPDGTPGGGVRNGEGATLTLNDCTFTGNNISGGGDLSLSYGAGLVQVGAGYLNVNRCTFADNTAGAGGGGLANLGGTVVVTNGTFTRNSAPNGGAIASYNYVSGSSNLDLNSSTIVNNTATTGAGKGGGVSQVFSGALITVTNSIIAENTSAGTAPNVSGAFVSQGSNVIGGAAGSTGFTNGANGDQVGVVDPQVGVLGSHGGLTDTLPLLASSAAINQANAKTAPVRDQRGYVRPDAPDVGAFEFGGTVPVALANISTRLGVGTGNNVLIGGFIVTGTEAKKVLVRAIGPSLPLEGTLANPTLELYDSAGLLLANDNWKMTQQAEIQATDLAPGSDLESAVIATLPANSSAYTAIVRGVNNTTGVGLVEVYDLDRTVDSKLANISTRGLVQTGDNVMIGGLIVAGSDPQTVIIRAIGPSLPLAGTLADPILELHDSNGVTLVSNDNWRSDQEAEILATNLAPSEDLESAIVRTLTPAAYTAIVRANSGAEGVALIEAYALSP
jgi:CSLREA domain-containing protein